MKLYLIIILQLFLLPINAQEKKDSSKTAYSYAASMTNEIDPQKFLGIWDSMDTLYHRIEFLYHNNKFMLASKSERIANQQFYSYEFFRSDSSSMVSSTGIIIKWPPDYCHIKQIDNNTIEVKYDFFGASEILINYRRTQNKAVW